MTTSLPHLCLLNLHESSVGAALDIQDDVSLPEDRPDVVLQHGGRELGVGSAQPRHQLARPGELQPVTPGLARPAGTEGQPASLRPRPGGAVERRPELSSSLRSEEHCQGWPEHHRLSPAPREALIKQFTFLSDKIYSEHRV